MAAYDSAGVLFVTRSHANAPRLVVIIVAWLTGVSALALLLYAVPPGFVTLLGLGWEGPDIFKEAIPAARAVTTAAPETFVAGLRAVVLCIWAAWIAATVAAMRGIPSTWTTLIGWFAVLVTAVALLMPPALSRDVLGYVAYGRLAFAHGLNPYTHGAQDLLAAGDPAAAFLVWETRLPYGPLWTLTAMAAAAAGSVGDLYGEVAAHKLIAAAALLFAAWGAARLVGAHTRDLAKPTFLAVVLNPLLFVEGPGNGHNDILMMALVVWGAASCAGRRWRTGAVLVGLAAAIKLVALSIAPLILIDYWLRHARRASWTLVLIPALVLVPTLVLSIPFGGPVPVLQGVRMQAQLMGGTGSAPIVLLGFGLGALMVWNSRARGSQGWLLAWVPVATALVFFATQYRYPWYATWLILPALTGATERHRQLLIAGCGIAVVLSWFYTVVP